MGESKSDDVKGRAKEAAGVLTGDKDLEREGKRDQAGAKVKEAAEKAADKVDDAVDAVKKKLDD
ncbi:MAG TPA: CsbD family protein [Acidimicrobiales bacterium]|nr:CsbD family protein [Acidimicrobiales bacterium]